MKYTLEYVNNLFDNNEHLKYIFFWGHHPKKDGSITKSCLSQWFDCTFCIDGITYNTAEQYMMSQKALLFNDMDIYRHIIQAKHPNECKTLGRQVKNFDLQVWQEHQTKIVIDGNLAKFSQNENLKEFLLSTNDRILVEASPYDTIWGIGLSSQTPNIENPYTWRGTNLLGFCLMEVRDRLSI